MFQRLVTLFAVALLFTACETAPKVTGDSASGSTSSGASAAAASSSNSAASGNASTTASSPSSSSSATAATSGETQISDEDKLAQVGNTVFFDFDSAELSAVSKNTLDRQAAFLNVNPALIIIVEGHADERGTREYNLALGDRRAVAVRDYLVAKGLNAARIRTVSYGKERPAVVGSNEDAWAKNRRAATVLN